MGAQRLGLHRRYRGAKASLRALGKDSCGGLRRSGLQAAPKERPQRATLLGKTTLTKYNEINVYGELKPISRTRQTGQLPRRRYAGAARELAGRGA